MSKLYDSLADGAPPACHKCVHYRSDDYFASYPTCSRIVNAIGQVTMLQEARATRAPCGPSGKLFEEKRTIEVTSPRAWWRIVP